MMRCQAIETLRLDSREHAVSIADLRTKTATTIVGSKVSGPDRGYPSICSGITRCLLAFSASVHPVDNADVLSAAILVRCADLHLIDQRSTRFLQLFKGLVFEFREGQIELVHG
jgi:hypothetical protein